MNQQIKQLAEQSGFVFWENEDWGPGPGNIDWSSDYKEEFDLFCKLLIQRCARIASAKAYGGFEAEEAIIAYFGVEQKELRRNLPIIEDEYSYGRHTTFE